MTATVVASEAMIENAKVSTADVLVSNGIVHVVDSVMMKQEDGATTTDSSSSTTDSTSTSTDTSSTGIIGSSFAIMSAVASMFL